MSVGRAHAVDHGSGRNLVSVLPRLSRAVADSQPTAEGALSVNQDERLVAIESRLEQVCSCMEKMSGHMDRVSSRLEIVARLEERWQHLDKQLGILTQSFERELARRSKIDDNLFDRVRVLESGGAMNSHGREMAERVALVILGGLALYTIQMVWGG